MKILTLIMLILSFELSASTIKIAAIAPEGSNWANTIRDMSQEIKQATKNKVNLKVYYGGVAGDESDVLRKIRVGQLQGGVFTGKTLGDIVGDIRVLEIPFNFYQNREKGFKAMQGMGDYFNKSIEAKGFVNLGFYEIGQVYFVCEEFCFLSSRWFSRNLVC
jgi:TRAP-type C4-dicarboxylate transport system substrate-binding protein